MMIDPTDKPKIGIKLKKGKVKFILYSIYRKLFSRFQSQGERASNLLILYNIFQTNSEKKDSS